MLARWPGLFIHQSTVAAARYLKHLYTIFGDWPLALASYNAGEGTVLRAIKRQGTTNYWDLKLPRQTEEYVPQFMAVLAIARRVPGAAPQARGWTARFSLSWSWIGRSPGSWVK